MKKFKTPFSSALDFFLKVSGVTQKELASEVGYRNRNSISAILLERTSGVEEKRRAIAEYFGCDYEEFLAIGQHLLNTQNDAPMPSLSLSRIEKIVREKLNERKKVNFKAILDAEKNCLCDFMDEVDKRHAAVIKGFKNRDLATRINEILVQIERFGEEELHEVFEDIELKLDRLKRKKGEQEGQSHKKTGTTDTET